MTDSQFQHWQMTTDKDGICWLTLDRKGASVNTINSEVVLELNQILDIIEQQNPVGVVITSGKPSGFVFGADISQFVDLKTFDEAFELIRKAQVVLDRLAAIKPPTVALINGTSMGGGTELALACRYRVAEENASIGLPEIKLGIHPGWGGTVRLPNLIGPVAAMTMILAGLDYPAAKCKKIGIVDDVVPKRHLINAARYYVMQKPKPQKASWFSWVLSRQFMRPLLGKQFYKSLHKNHVNKDHYPAPYAVVDAWIENGTESDRAMIGEAKSIAKLMISETARNLVRVFFLRKKLKDLAKKAEKIQHVHVVGAGTMGGDIAAWCALKGMHVTLQDQTAEQIAPAIKRAYKLFEKKLKAPNKVQQAMDRLQPDVEGLGVARADLVIEAIFENSEIKQKLYKKIEPKLKSGAILATNTSTIPLEELATALANPARLIGLHFFNPVSKMPLVEVVRGAKSSSDPIEKAMSFVGQIDRLPLPVMSRPGFLVNRVLMPYFMEALMLNQEGIPKEQIDKAALLFGMPMGPMTLADAVGLDVMVSAARTLAKHYGGEVPQQLIKMVEAGNLGLKSGKGFYEYKNGKKVSSDAVEPATVISNTDIIDRLILRMLNEAVACLHEGIVPNTDLLDAGVIFGTGFAPFRGGLIQYAKSRGIVDVVSTLERLSNKYGERFKPYVGWELLIETSEKLLEEIPENKPKKKRVVHDNVAKSAD